MPRQGDEILTVATFKKIKEHVLAHGDRQTYCNMFNNNPHVALGNMDIYLNPDTGQQNINCDPEQSDFNSMVIRTREPWKYYRVWLSLETTGPDLVTDQDTEPDVLRRRFEEALSEIEQTEDGRTEPQPATE